MVKYADYIRSLRCALCEAPPPSELHHLIGVGIYPGMGLKAADELAIPVCRHCHCEIHKGWHIEDQPRLLIRMLDRAVRDGWGIAKKEC